MGKPLATWRGLASARGWLAETHLASGNPVAALETARSAAAGLDAAGIVLGLSQVLGQTRAGGALCGVARRGQRRTRPCTRSSPT